MKSIRARQAAAMKTIQAEIEAEILPLFSGQARALGFDLKPVIKWEEDCGDVTMEATWTGTRDNKAEYLILRLRDNNTVYVCWEDAFDEDLTVKGIVKIERMVKNWRKLAA